MGWTVVINSEGAWVDHAVIPLDPPSGWVEAWDDAIPGYKQQTFDTEHEANCIARRFRAYGFSAATEQLGHAVPTVPSVRLRTN